MKHALLLELALLGAGLAPAPALARPPADGTSETWRGHCEYGGQIAKYINGKNGFALCDEVVFTQNGEHAAFAFRQEGSGTTARYEGVLAGDKLAVATVQLGERAPRRADGSCTIHRRDGEISGVTCIVTADRMGYGANFVRRD